MCFMSIRASKSISLCYNKLLNITIMLKDKIQNINQEGKKRYEEIALKLRQEYPGNFYVAIEPKTGEYFVGNDSLKVLKEARRKYPRKTFFGAHVGYLAGRI